MDLREKAAYILGLSDGILKDSNEPNAKLLRSICEFLSEMAAKVENLDEAVEDIYGEIDNLDPIDGDDDDDDSLLEIVCPGCEEKIYIDIEELEDEMVCPACGEVIEIDFGECCCEDCEDCGDDGCKTDDRN